MAVGVAVRGWNGCEIRKGGFGFNGRLTVGDSGFVGLDAEMEESFGCGGLVELLIRVYEGDTYD